MFLGILKREAYTSRIYSHIRLFRKLRLKKTALCLIQIPK
jgi:hypothetical protein